MVASSSLATVTRVVFSLSSVVIRTLFDLPLGCDNEEAIGLHGTDSMRGALCRFQLLLSENPQVMDHR